MEINKNRTNDEVIDISIRGTEANSDQLEGWWCSSLEARNIHGYDSPIHTLASSGNRVFRGGIRYNVPEEYIWDVSDLLIEMYEQERRREKLHSSMLRGTQVPTLPRFSTSQAWLTADRGNGFVLVHRPDQTNPPMVVPCRLTTTAHDICLQLGVANNAMHVVYGGLISRRLGSLECPLAIQNDYLAGLGHTTISDVQEEGTNSDLKHLIALYSGKPPFARKLASNQLQEVLNVKKAGVLKQWVHRLCVLSDSRVFIYKDKQQDYDPFVLQLAKGSVEDVNIKGHEHCIKLTNGENQMYLSFNNVTSHNTWLTRCTKAADNAPLAADLSNCSLESLPENLLMNESVEMLNLSNNCFRERYDTDTIHVEGWLDDLPRYKQLSSLNLANNNLGTFPLSLCAICTLLEVNLSGNQLTEIPGDIRLLTSLRVLHIHNNHLTSLPDQLVGVRSLNSLALAFNRFVSLPAVAAQVTNIRLTDVDCVSMAGNHIEKLSSDDLTEMKYARRVDLRLNSLTLPTTDTLKFTVLERLTHLNVSDNRIKELDLHSLRMLEYLNCERNTLTSLHLNGTTLRTLFAADNKLEFVEIIPKPESLLILDLSRNCLVTIPDWMGECVFLHTVKVCNNHLTHLPEGLFSQSKKLRIVHAGYNQLTTLPSEFESLYLERLELQQNELTSLPVNLLVRANWLKYLNLTRNHLSNLPPGNNNIDLNRIEQLYLSGNQLGNDVLEVVSCYPRLKVLHLAFNEISEIYDSEIKKMTSLRELNVSGNQLTSLPSSLGYLQNLYVLRAHSNALHSLPDLHGAKLLRVLDVGHNQLLNVSVTQLMASQISLFDMSLNSQLKIDPEELKSVKNKKRVCLVDLTGQNRSMTGSSDEQQQGSLSSLCKVGFAEKCAVDKKLCIATLRMLQFSSEGESLFGMIDGHNSPEIPMLVVDNIADVLQLSMARYNQATKFMKHAVLTMHSKLTKHGQCNGASLALVHIQRQSGHSLLNIANVGDVEVVLCRHGDPVVLTHCFTTNRDREECLRVCKSDGIITEDGLINGVTRCSRQLGFYQLYPHVIPDPYVNSVSLRGDDEFIIIANAVFWTVVTPLKAVSEVRDVHSPVAAAKKLQDLAQGCSAGGDMSVLVIRLISSPLRSSKLDISVAQDALKVRSGNTFKSGVQPTRPPPVAVAAGSGVEPSRTSNTNNTKQSQLSETNSLDSKIQQSVNRSREEFVRTAINIEGSKVTTDSSVTHSASTPALKAFVASSTPGLKAPVVSIKPLPQHRFVKKGTAGDWDAVIQKRLSGEVKDHEIRQVGTATVLTSYSLPVHSNSLSSLSSPGSSISGRTSVLPPDHAAVLTPGVDTLNRKVVLPSQGDSSQVHLSNSVERSTLLRHAAVVNPKWSIGSRNIASTPASAPNPAYAVFEDDEDNDETVIAMMSPAASSSKKRLSIANKIAMFEQSKPHSDVESMSSVSSNASKRSSLAEQLTKSTSESVSSSSPTSPTGRTTWYGATPNPKSNPASRTYLGTSHPAASASVSSQLSASTDIRAVEVETNGGVKVIDIARL